MRGAVAAKAGGYLDAYIEAGLSAMWEQGLNMSDAEIFTKAMNAAGLDGEAILAATQNPEVKKGLIDNTAAAVERGAFGIPTFYVDGEMFFGKDRLGQLEEMITG